MVPGAGSRALRTRSEITLPAVVPRTDAISLAACSTSGSRSSVVRMPADHPASRIRCQPASTDAAVTPSRFPPASPPRRRRPLPLPPTSAVMAGPGHNPARPQPSPNRPVPTKRRASSGRSGGTCSVEAETGRPRRTASPVEQPERRRAARHQADQRRVPGAGDVEEPEHHRRIGRPRDDEAGAEQQAGAEADGDRDHSADSGVSHDEHHQHRHDDEHAAADDRAARHASDAADAVAAGAAAAVARADADQQTGGERERPRRRRARRSPSGSATVPTTPAATSPTTNAARHAQSRRGAGHASATMPVMPETRPSSRTTRPEAVPTQTPPMKARSMSGASSARRGDCQRTSRRRARSPAFVARKRFPER